MDLENLVQKQLREDPAFWEELLSNQKYVKFLQDHPKYKSGTLHYFREMLGNFENERWSHFFVDGIVAQPLRWTEFERSLRALKKAFEIIEDPIKGRKIRDDENLHEYMSPLRSILHSSYSIYQQYEEMNLQHGDVIPRGHGTHFVQKFNVFAPAHAVASVLWYLQDRTSLVLLKRWNQSKLHRLGNGRVMTRDDLTLLAKASRHHKNVFKHQLNSESCRKKARTNFKKLGYFEAAAELAYESKKFDYAIDLLEKANCLYPAARLAEVKGFSQKSIDLYLKNKDFDWALNAAWLDVDKAYLAQMLLDLPSFEHEMYSSYEETELINSHELAISLSLQAGTLNDVADRILSQERIFHNQLHTVCKSLIEIGEFKRAVDGYLRYGFHDEAAMIAIKSGRVDLAAQCYEGAAISYKNKGDAHKAFEYYSKALIIVKRLGSNYSEWRDELMDERWDLRDQVRISKSLIRVDLQ